MIGCDDGVDRTYIDVIGMKGITCLDEILDECLETEEKEGEALDVCETIQETVHLVFGGGQFHLTVLIPEVFIVHGGIGFTQSVAFDVLEKRTGYFLESHIAESGEALHLKLAEPLGELQFDKHVIGGGNAVACVQLGEVLRDDHVLDKIDIAASGDAEFDTSHLIGGVGIEENVEIA